MGYTPITCEAMSEWCLEVENAFYSLGLERLETREERLPIWLARVRRHELEEPVLLGRAEEPDLPHECDEVLPGYGQVVIGLALILRHATMTVGKLGSPCRMAVLVDPCRDSEVQKHPLHINDKRIRNRGKPTGYSILNGPAAMPV